MTGTIAMATIAGGLAAGVLMWAIRQRKVNTFIHTLDGAGRRIANLLADLTKHAAQVEADMQEAVTLEIMVGQMRDAATDQLRVTEQLRTELQSATTAREHWASHAGRATEEAMCLHGLALTFGRWHEQMTPLMEQNHDIHAKGEELQSTVRHVVIVSLNTSIGAVCAGTVGRGFVVVASEVRALTAHSEKLSKGYRNSLHLNDLTTTAMFQDIQVDDKMITASLSSVEALASQFQHQPHQVGLA